MRQKLQNIIEHLNQGLVGRDETIKAALLCALAGENIVLIGPPGTGKSMLARRIAQAFEDGDSYFEYLLTKFSTPEELFGPLSIKKLKEDQFERNTTGYLPSVQFAFLDEVFKASSSILNALLTIMNERIYHNGAQPQPQRVPLRSLIAASNELPASQDELGALYDRFLMRCFVDYVDADDLGKLINAGNRSSTWEKSTEEITVADLQALAQQINDVVIPTDIAQVIKNIWLEHKQAFKEDRQEQLSDRRLTKVLHLLRVSAATNERIEVDYSDILLLNKVLWNNKENVTKISKLVLSNILLKNNKPNPQSNIVNFIKAENCTGEHIDSMVVVAFPVKTGDILKKGQIVCQLETDKARIEVASIYEGMVSDVLVKVGQRINRKTSILRIESSSSEVLDLKSKENDVLRRMQNNIWL